MGDAKWKIKATYRDVDQVRRYKGYPFCADTGVLHYPRNAYIPPDVKEYAKRKNIRIVKTMVPKTKEPIPSWKPILEMGYPR